MSRSSSPLLSLILALAAPVAPAGVLVATMASSTAQAATFASPVLAFLHQGEVTGDGKTETTVDFLLVDADGKPATEFSGRFSATSGNTGKPTLVAPGHFRATWTPPAVDDVTNVRLNVKAKVGTGAVNQDLTVSVRPVARYGVSVTADPTSVVLGQDSTATVKLSLTGGATGPRDDADLVVTTSSGTAANVTNLGGGQYSLLYTAPDKLFPHLALITVSDRRDSEATSGAFALPLVGKASFPVQGEPDASLLVRVGTREFGPVQANAQGKATVPLTVPPGVRTATVISIKDGARTEAQLDLKVPTSQRVKLLPTVPQLPADGKRTATVRVFVAQPDGSPDGAAKVTFQSSAGTVGAAKHEGGGIYAATWTPPKSGAPLTATISVDVADDGGAQTDKLEVKLLPALPDAMTLEAAPDKLPGTDGKVVVSARISDNSGARGVTLGASNAQASSAGSRQTDGTWTTPFQTPGNQPAIIQGAVAAPASDRPLARLLVFPATDVVRPDGASETVVTVLSLDGDGYPVPQAPVALEVIEGDAVIGGSITTDEHGIAHLRMTAGKTAGLVRIQAASGGHVGQAVLFQADAGFTAPASGMGGDPATMAAWQAWNGRVNSIVVPRPGQPVALTTPPATTTTPTAISGPVATLAVSPDPAQVPPGAEVKLVVTAKDGQGRGVTGAQLQLFPSAGTIGSLSDKGDGTYEAKLTAPASGTDMIRVTVVNPASGISQMIEVPVGLPGPTWGVAEAAAAENSGPPQESEVREAPVIAAPDPEVREVAPEKQPKPEEEGDHPWVQVQAGFLGGFYSYQQTPAAAGGPLYGERIAFGGGETAAAGAAGLALGARAWSPGMKYFGAELGFRTTGYKVELADFGSVVPDWLNQFQATLMARYPVDIDRTRLHAGAKAGVSVDDFMIYRQDLSGDSPVLDYGPLVVPSFAVGLELGADYDGTVFGEASVLTGLNGGGGGLYGLDIDARIGWAFMDSLYAYGNLGWAQRSTGVYIQDSDRQSAGDLDDAFTMLGAGIGWQN
ncbi:MAG: hypothetical protein H6742_20190 [Alphaproteobacteria bacterium]|nr:hypothetical protein [Alphaproteobacteria bacterium]